MSALGQKRTFRHLIVIPLYTRKRTLMAQLKCHAPEHASGPSKLRITVRFAANNQCKCTTVGRHLRLAMPYTRSYCCFRWQPVRATPDTSIAVNDCDRYIESRTKN